MHTKTDSEDTSLAPSSPDNRGPTAYYVQSPSRDSHDGEKTTTSFHSTPVISPMGSPPHSHSSVGRHSRDSSSSRFSGSLKPGSQKILPDAAGGVGGRHHRKGQKPWKECDVIEEEGLLEDDRSSKSLPRRCYVLAFVVGFFVLFSFFALILWGASRPQKPKITMRVSRFLSFWFYKLDDLMGDLKWVLFVFWFSDHKIWSFWDSSWFWCHRSSNWYDLHECYCEIPLP